MEYIAVADLSVAKNIYDLVNEEIIPGTQVEADQFWQSLSELVGNYQSKNRSLLDKRDALQSHLDDWAKNHAPLNIQEQKQFLQEIGYLLPEGEKFRVAVDNVDPEIAKIAGPQLVVPVDNARYAINAANARWGSLYDALYGTDAIEPADPAMNGYDAVRGQKVVAYAKNFLDQSVPLEEGTYSQVTEFQLTEKNNGSSELSLVTSDNESTSLKNPEQFVGYQMDGEDLSEVILKNHGLHIRICFDRTHPIGREDPAHIKDIILESAITTIQDFEDSVAAVDAVDKEVVYRNWLGLMKGNLETEVSKGGGSFTRRLNPDIEFVDKSGQSAKLPGRSLLFVRNVGLHMYTNAILNKDGEQIPEGFLDLMISVLAAKHDLLSSSGLKNSRTGSIYIVKPKLHGPEEVAFTVTLFEQTEKSLGLAENTIKIGIMDEERRTSVNLKECIRAARNRVVFINTGFLDRTGDEIHTCMHAGPVIPKPEIKSSVWLLAYEDWNVDIGLETGLSGTAQIGKGMWPMPDSMKAMLDTKIGHVNAGANTAWVPSPTGATLHALHYHQVDIFHRQDELKQRSRASLNDLLTPPLLVDRELSAEEINKDLENNAQGILGYVVRWVGQGVGCSKVPDINDVGLMEDRATLRISSQHIANWLLHGIVSEQQVMDTMKRMATVVDRQNESDPLYRSMSVDFDNSIEFQAALDLIFEGVPVANGYTEPVLHRRRQQYKSDNHC